MEKGYIILNPKTGHKAYIPDWEQLKKDAESMKEEGFWKHYREMKKSDPHSYTVQKVKNYSKKKSDYERASINYPIRLWVGVKFRKFGEDCDVNTEPSFIVI